MHTWLDIGKQKIKDIAIWAGKKLNKNYNYIQKLENKLKNLSEEEHTKIGNIEELKKQINNYTK
jgi:hypothetical protein